MKTTLLFFSLLFLSAMALGQYDQKLLIGKWTRQEMSSDGTIYLTKLPSAENFPLTITFNKDKTILLQSFYKLTPDTPRLSRNGIWKVQKDTLFQNWFKNGAENNRSDIAYIHKLTKDSLVFGTKPLRLTNQKEEEDAPTFTKIETQAYFPGGQKALEAFIRTNFKLDNKYKPKEATTMWFKLTVLSDGSIDKQSISVIKGINPYCNEEGIRVLSQLPKYVPATVNNRKVASEVKIPITVSLQ